MFYSCLLVDDCIHCQASLDAISAFPFDNYLGKIKSMLRGIRRLVAQLYHGARVQYQTVHGNSLRDTVRRNV